MPDSGSTCKKGPQRPFEVGNGPHVIFVGQACPLLGVAPKVIEQARPERRAMCRLQFW
jgi:hypothetical protein